MLYQLGVSGSHVKISNIHEPSKTMNTIYYLLQTLWKKMWFLNILVVCNASPYKRRYALVSISQG